MQDKQRKKSKKSIDEPNVIIKPIGRLGGLDNIHVALVVLVVILMALLLIVSYNKPIQLPINQTTTTNQTSVLCPSYGAANGKCIVPSKNATSVKLFAEQVLASYGSINDSLSILPYITNVSAMRVYYLSNSSLWLAVIPAVNPSNKQAFYLSMLISDKNNSYYMPFEQLAKPPEVSANYVVSEGVIDINRTYTCLITSPLQQYWFIDPYAPGSIASLSNMTSIQSRFNGKVSTQLNILYTQASQSIENQYGMNNTLALGEYLFCASKQSNAGSFYRSVQNAYANSYMAPSTLASLAASSGLNTSSLDSCLSSSATLINRQALNAKLYNITSTPSVVTDCKYLSIPQTAVNAVCYANSTLC